MEPRHPAFDALDSSLAELVSDEPVDFDGDWLTSVRRKYSAAREHGPGLGPFDEVMDLRWCGALTSPAPVAGLAFLATATDVFWSRSAPPSVIQRVELSFHMFAAGEPAGATFTASLGESMLPGVPVAGSLSSIQGYVPAPAQIPVGRVVRVARVDSVEFLVLLLPGRLLEVARKRLWHLRDPPASSLPAGVRELLTRRRTGVIRLLRGTSG